MRTAQIPVLRLHTRLVYSRYCVHNRVPSAPNLPALPSLLVFSDQILIPTTEQRECLFSAMVPQSKAKLANSLRIHPHTDPRITSRMLSVTTYVVSHRMGLRRRCWLFRAAAIECGIGPLDFTDSLSEYKHTLTLVLPHTPLPATGCAVCSVWEMCHHASPLEAARSW